MQDKPSNPPVGLRLKFGPARQLPPEKSAGMVGPKRNIGRIVLEHGVELTWPCTDEPNGDQAWEDLRTYKAKVGLRHVLVQDVFADGKSIESLVGTDERDLALIREMYFRGGEDDQQYDQMASLGYVLSAVIYHCQRLVNQYCYVAKSIPDSMQGNRMDCGFQSGTYHEFDALVTCIRRGYDALRQPLWKLFGNGSHKPSNFPSTLKACSKMPVSLNTALQRSWEEWGQVVTEYRDCIIHYVPVNTWLSTVTVERLHDGRKKVVAPIPDNPATKSRKQFKYERRLDALTFGWEATSELFRIAVIVREEVRKAHNE